MLLGLLHDALSEPEGSIRPGAQVLWRQSIGLDLQWPMYLGEVLRVEERCPAVRVDGRQDGHGLALLDDVRSKGPPVSLVTVGKVLTGCPDGAR